MSWCFANEGGVYSEKILASLSDSSAIVPSLWVYEITNVLVIAEKKKRLTANDSSRYLNLLFQLPIEIDDSLPNSTELLRLARDLNLTSYDAAYLELAIRCGAPIATLDQALSRAAKKIGINSYLT